MCDLLDLLGGSDEPLQPSMALPPPSGPASLSSAGGELLDLLGGLAPPQGRRGGATLLEQLYLCAGCTKRSITMHNITTCVCVSTVPCVKVYEQNGVTLTLQCDRQTDTALTITLIASNSSHCDITQFTLQAAVPKVCVLRDSLSLF